MFAKNLKLLVQFLIVLLLAGCSTTTHMSYVPQIEEDSETVRKVTSGINAVVELTNNRFKMFVRNSSSDIAISLFIPAGEELFMQKPTIVVTNTSNPKIVASYQGRWNRSFQMDEVAEAELGPDTDRLVGLTSSPPATIYFSNIVVLDEGYSEFTLELPVFRTRDGEIVNFKDISIIKVTTNEIVVWSWNDTFYLLGGLEGLENVFFLVNIQA